MRGESLRESVCGMGWWVHYKYLISGLGDRFLILCLMNKVTYQVITVTSAAFLPVLSPGCLE